MADLHSWQASHWLNIRERENGEDGGGNKGVRDCREKETGERKL